MAPRLVTAAVIGGIVALGIAVVVPRQYTARASFIPDAGQLPGLFAGLVGQFVGAQTDRISPRLAGDLLRSDPILSNTLYQRLPAHDSAGATARLIDRLRPNEDDSALAEVAALKALRRQIAVDVNERTGLVEVSVTLRDPVLAASVANRLVDLVDEFNAQTRQTRAGALRRFLEARAGVARGDLLQAESNLQNFYMLNRAYEESPKLRFAEGRLRREVDLRQQLYLSLSTQLEQARIDEVKDTPVLTRVAAATVPPKRSFPRLSIFVMFGVLIGAFLAAIPTVWLAYTTWYRGLDAEGFSQFQGAWMRATAGLRRLVRR